MNALRLIELATIGVYFVVVLALGLCYRRNNRDIDDYFRSRCQGSWWLVGVSGFMTSFSAFNFTGVAGTAYEAGWSALVIFLATTLAFLLNAAVLAPWFRQLRAISAAQLIRMRFDGVTHQVFAWLTVLTQVLFAAIQLYGLTLFCAAIFHLDLETTILAVGAIVVFASWIGGSWAVMATDFVQGVLVVPVMILLTSLCLAELGGWTGLLDLIQARGLAEDYRIIQTSQARFHGQFTLLWAIAMVLKGVVTYNGMSQAPRYFLVKDGADARRAALLAAGLTALGSLCWIIPPMAARLLFPEAVEAVQIGKPAEAAYAVAATRLLPAGMSGLMLVAVLSATMSSMDTGLNRNAAIFTLDLYPPIARRLGLGPAREATLLRLGQAFTLGLGVLILAVTLQFARAGAAGIFQLGLTLSTALGVPLTVPLFMSLFIRRSPRWAGLFSALATAVPSTLGLIAGTALVTRSPFAWVRGLGFLQESWSFQQQALLNLGVGAAAYVLTMPFWSTASAAYRQQTDEFFATMTRPVDFAAEVGEDNTDSQSRTLGGFSLAVGLGISALALVPNPWSWNGRLGVLFVAGLVVATGAALLAIGRRARKPHLSPAACGHLEREC